MLAETLEQTRTWLKHIDYKEGVFLQQYLGRLEGSHIALSAMAEIYSLISNQEYKRAFDGNQGIVAGAPLGGLVEQDPEDKYKALVTCCIRYYPGFVRLTFLLIPIQ